ncbi:MAG: c-type cytochrome [Myxococcales bacterium]|nr:c-type cytochrome [Myxococcales bacterium]
MSAKLAPEWLLAWLRAPRGTSPKTRMPNLWPAPLEPASKVPEPAGSPAHADWLSLRASETVAVAAFLYERSEEPSLRPGTAPGTRPLRETVTALDPGAVAGASAALGRQMFEGYGCQGCHTRHAEDVPGEPVPDAWRVRERDAAPTLASIGLKTTPSWLYYWLQKPSRYWAGAAMPDLRLSDLEAASLALYLATLKSPLPDPAPVTAAEAASVRDPAARRAEVPCEAAGGALLPRADCGAKLVAERGCFGCHRIAGFDELAHIAPDLGGFAKKDPSTLDFAYALADPDLQTVETFAALKLDAPRIFARDRILLRMGDFDVSPQEIRALLVFLAGLTPDRPNAAFDPMARPAYAAPVRGRELVEGLACRGCHVIEGRGADLDGFRTAALADDAQARAPVLDGEGLRVTPTWLYAFLRTPGDNGVRPWLHPEWVWPGRAHEEGAFALRMPSYALGDDDLTALVRYWSAWDGQRYPYEAPAVPARSAEEQAWAEKVMTSAQAANCMSCHYVGTLPAGAGRDLASLAPDLGKARGRLRPEWVKAWLLGPKAFQPHTRMPSLWASASDLRPDDAALFPGEPDPFRSPAPAWGVAPAFEALPNEAQIELVRDFVFALPAGGPFPRGVAAPP